MIRTKTELKFYIMADRRMNRNKFKLSFKDFFKYLLFPDYIMRYLKSMRYSDYHSSLSGISKYNPIYLYHRIRYHNLGLKLGFSINYKVLGYGVVIPHYGTIVIGSGNKIGNFAVLHSSTCIDENVKSIGDGLYLSTGAKIIKSVRLGDNISIAANSVVNKDFPYENCLLAGMPAEKKCDCKPWYIRDGEKYHQNVEAVNKLRLKLKIKS